FHGTQSPKEFRRNLVETMDKERGLKPKGIPVLSEAEIDKLLYQSLPLYPVFQLGDRLNTLFAAIPGLSERDCAALMQIWESLPSPIGMETVATADMLQDIAKALLSLHFGATSFPTNFHQLVVQAARQCQFALPAPIVFADSNWARYDFG